MGNKQLAALWSLTKVAGVLTKVAELWPRAVSTTSLSFLIREFGSIQSGSDIRVSTKVLLMRAAFEIPSCLFSTSLSLSSFLCL